MGFLAPGSSRFWDFSLLGNCLASLQSRLQLTLVGTVNTSNKILYVLLAEWTTWSTLVQSTVAMIYECIARINKFVQV